jgi:hypothetical protein
VNFRDPPERGFVKTALPRRRFCGQDARGHHTCILPSQSAFREMNAVEHGTSPGRNDGTTTVASEGSVPRSREEIAK